MALLTKTAIVGQVLLTAIMTLVAGMPHFSCVCPDGSLKANCFTFSSGSCCCGTGNCCGATDGEGCCSRSKNSLSTGEGKRPCCGQHQDQKARGLSGGSFESKAPCCNRSLAVPDAASASYSKTLPSKDISFESLSISVSSLSPVAKEAKFAGLWQTHQVAPPTDLFAIFCHLII